MFVANIRRVAVKRTHQISIRFAFVFCMLCACMKKNKILHTRKGTFMGKNHEGWFFPAATIHIILCGARRRYMNFVSTKKMERRQGHAHIAQPYNSSDLITPRRHCGFFCVALVYKILRDAHAAAAVAVMIKVITPILYQLIKTKKKKNIFSV